MRETIEIVKQIKEEGFAPILLFPETQRLIELVRADEREQCAKVCDARAIEHYGFTEEQHASEELAKAIRARGNA